MHISSHLSRASTEGVPTTETIGHGVLRTYMTRAVDLPRQISQEPLGKTEPPNLYPCTYVRNASITPAYSSGSSRHVHAYYPSPIKYSVRSTNTFLQVEPQDSDPSTHQCKTHLNQPTVVVSRWTRMSDPCMHELGSTLPGPDDTKIVRPPEKKKQ
ncbi:hypothetical protein BDV37DRAFT_239011 [Aspergillus pseudonomiae]|uniref:Uncharacterized protein n=1 Tax=Aspergillus pseudonomiae TaxID=1506151 RepID=A0A5N7DP19_9EURO|nr:uncharacterized protein BDV37DRAFT_239011 [Aspergillus pseudonomiae]KAE8408192.1 hypothetical protein BDV37DRAFT_239011 [Aspergillus pseudonomiae]